MEDLEELIGGSELPVLCNLRGEAEGGRFEGSADERLAVLKKVVDYGPAYVDFDLASAMESQESNTFIRGLKDKDIKVVISAHNLEDCYSEDEIEELCADMDLKESDFFCFRCKISTYTHIANLFASSYEMRTRNIMFAFEGLGKLGKKLSIFAPMMSSAMTFCAAEEEKKRGGDSIDLAELNKQWKLLLGNQM